MSVRQKKRRTVATVSMIERLRAGGTVGRDEALAILEALASKIIEGQRVPGIGYGEVAGLVNAIAQHPLSEFACESVTVVRVGDPATVVQIVSLLRGVQLGLDGDLRLQTLVVSPAKLKEREQLLAFVGVGRDSQSDVAEHHDDYLVDAFLNAGKSGKPD